jgi:rhodanese-related sulfurtransferase/uridine phosphorylase
MSKETGVPASRSAPTAPILANKRYSAPSAFTPENLLREARRQKGLAVTPVPEICVLDPDGDMVRRLRATCRAHRDPAWACYHTGLYRLTETETELGLVGCAVGAPFAVLVAEQLFASGCRLLISMTSAGRLAELRPPPYFVLIERALRDEGTSYHYLPPAEFSAADTQLLEAMTGAFAHLHVPVERDATSTTDAPFRETQEAIDAMTARDLLAVEMEAAALYAFAAARSKLVLCFAHVTNQMALVEGDFEKARRTAQSTLSPSFAPRPRPGAEPSSDQPSHDGWDGGIGIGSSPDQPAVRAHGRPPAGAKLILLHAFADSGLAFIPLFATPLASRFRLVAVDLAGFGASPAQDDVRTIIDHVIAIAKLVECLPGGGPVGLVAHSVASMIAVEAVTRLRGRFAGLFSIEGNLTADDAYLSGRAAGFDDPVSFKARFLDDIWTMAQEQLPLRRFFASAILADPTAMVSMTSPASLAGTSEVVTLIKALGRVGERNVADVNRVLHDYFHARDAMEPVSREELANRLKSGTVTVLDVRPEEEFALGHIPGAINVPIGRFKRRPPALPKDREIVAYCRGPYCVMSFDAVAALRAKGHRIRRLEDGFPEWKAAGLKVEIGA